MTESDGSRFSLVGFAVAVVMVGAGAAAGLAFVPVAGTYVGMLLGGFVAGLVLEDRPLLEAGVAAVLASFGILLAGTLVGNGIVDAVLALATIAPTTLLVSVVLSFAVGAFGANFGDDLRDGLTEPVETAYPNPSVFDTAGSRLSATESSGVERAERDSTDRGSERPEKTESAADAGTDWRSADVEPEDVESADVELEREK